MKTKSLMGLRSKIIDEVHKETWRDVWFFPEYNGVKGYLGTQDVVFLALNPSFGRFPSSYDEFFYAELKKHGFGEAHLTDLLKIRATTKDLKDLVEDEKVIKDQKRYLADEINIIDPRIIVTLGISKFRKGTRYAEILADVLKGRSIKMIRIRHYSSIRFPENKAKFREELRGIKSKYIEPQSSGI